MPHYRQPLLYRGRRAQVIARLVFNAELAHRPVVACERSGPPPDLVRLGTHVMNEVEPSVRTYGILERLDRALGVQDGTRPDDNSLLRSLRGQSRMCQSRMEGEKKGRARIICQMLSSRGIEVSEGFPFNVPGFAESPEVVIVAAGIGLR